MCEEKKEAGAEEDLAWIGECMRDRRMALLTLDPEHLCEAVQDGGPWVPSIETWLTGVGDGEDARRLAEGYACVGCWYRWEANDLVLRIVGTGLTPAIEGAHLPVLGRVILRPWAPPPPEGEEGAASAVVCVPEDLGREVKIDIKAITPPASFEIGPGEEAKK